MVVFICTQPEVSEILWLFLKNGKFRWPTELTISHIRPDDGLNPSIKVIPFLSASHVQHTWMIVREHNVQKTLMFLKSQHCLVIQVHEQYTITTWFHFRKIYKKILNVGNSKSRGKRINTVCTLKISLNSFKDLTFPWLKVEFPDFSLTLKKLSFPWPFPDLWQPYGN